MKVTVEVDVTREEGKNMPADEVASALADAVSDVTFEVEDSEYAATSAEVVATAKSGGKEWTVVGKLLDRWFTAYMKVNPINLGEPVEVSDADRAELHAAEVALVCSAELGEFARKARFAK